MKTLWNHTNSLVFWMIFVGVITGVGVLSGVIGCDKEPPLKIGFVGGLTGRLSDLGMLGRDGVMLAVEQINEAGGIRGRPIELLVKDDRQDPDVARQVDKELLTEGVVVVIGHMTSAMSVAAVPLMNQNQVVLISPTTSANELSDLDDYFFRVCPESKTQTEQLVYHAFHVMGLRKMSGIFDLSNRSFAEELYTNFISKFEEMGGRIAYTTTFTSDENLSYLEMTKQLLDSDPEGLFIVAGAIDTALICQQVRKFEPALPIISSAWALTPDLIQHGGSAVEGLIFSESFYKESSYEPYVKFARQFQERFGKEPGFAGTFSYEAAQVVFTALSIADDAACLKETFLTQRIFPGLQGDIRFNRYGDAQRKRFLITVRNGQFLTIE